MKIFTFFIALAVVAAAHFVGAAQLAGPVPAAVLFGIVINQASLVSAYTGFKTIFQGAFDGAATVLDKLYMVVPSTAKWEEYKWFGSFPRMREWIGDRVVKALSVDGFLLKNRDFEATVSVDRNDLEDDQIGIYRPMFEQLGQSAKQHPDQLIAELLTAGFTALGFDKVTFFNAAHPNGNAGTFSNLMTGVNSALSADSYAAARAQMQSLVNDEGAPLKVIPNLLVVPPQLEATARAILRADKTANGATNIWQNSADLLVVPELAANPKKWYLADVSRSAKPFVLQTRKAPEFVALDKANDENAFFRKEYIYGVDSRGNAGFGLPHLILGSTGE